MSPATLDDLHVEETHAPFYQHVRHLIQKARESHPGMAWSHARWAALQYVRFDSEQNYQHLMNQRGMAVVKDANDYLKPEQLFGIPMSAIYGPVIDFALFPDADVARYREMMAPRNRTDEIYGRSPMGDLLALMGRCTDRIRITQMVCHRKPSRYRGRYRYRPVS